MLPTHPKFYIVITPITAINQMAQYHKVRLPPLVGKSSLFSVPSAR
jgi:hypothetical protein